MSKIKSILKKNIALLLLLTSSLYANALNDMFKNAKVNGDVTIHSLGFIQKISSKDIGFINSSIGLGLQTKDYYGFSTALLFRSNHKLWENYRGDAEEVAGTLLAVANIQYHNKFMTLIVGRQELELEWIEDIHQAIVLYESAREDTDIVLGHSAKIADADDEVSKFEKIGEVGAYVLDIKNRSID